MYLDTKGRSSTRSGFRYIKKLKNTKKLTP